jgi:hypothetical protein
MKSGGWIPISKGCVKYLPKDRAYTELEAMLCIQMDYDAGNKATIAGYADLWRWSRGKVYRFIKKVGIKIIYPQDTTRLRKQRGIITPSEPEKINWRFMDNKTDIRRNTRRTLDNEENQSVTETKKHKTDIRRNTTIETKRLNTNNSSKNCPYGDIFDLFREYLPELTKPTKMTATRQKHLKARWHGGYKASSGLKSDSADFWKGFFQHIQKSDFLMGRNSEWQATFDWIINESNFVKILEGNYHK